MNNWCRNQFKYQYDNGKGMRKLLILTVCLAFTGISHLPGQDVGNPGPDFEVNLQGGGMYSLSAQAGKVVFVYLFGNSCPFCIASGPSIESSIYQVFAGNSEFTAVGVDTWNSSSSEASVSSFRNKTGITFPLAIKAGFVASDYETTYDRLMVIDKHGKLVHKGVLAADNDINNAVSAIRQSLAEITEVNCDTIQLDISFTSTSPTCNGESDGAIDVSVAGDYPDFFYQWSNGATTQDLNGLNDGSYQVNVTDAEGCTESLEVTITDTAAIAIDETITELACAGDSTGAIDITIIGGSAPYTISWFGDSAIESVSGLGAGCYHVMVSDVDNCTAQKEICIPEPEEIMAGEISGDNAVEPSNTHTYSINEKLGVMYHWVVDGGQITSGIGTRAVDVQWDNEIAGSIRVVLVSEKGCVSDTSSLNVSINAVGIERPEEKIIAIYPNPVHDILHLSIDGDFLVSIRDLAGNFLMATNRSQIDLSSVKQGVYIIAIRSGDQTTFKKIIKQ